MKTIQQLCHNELQQVNSYIQEALHSPISLVEDIASYIINAGGKRLRPLLVILVSRALDHDNNNFIKLAAIIECLHTATLLHDDVVDESSQRRGRPTANTNWGNASSILVGDFIYSRAFQMIVSLNNHQVTATLAQATSEISEGEVQQLMNAGNSRIDEQTYFETITRKTATLFAAACKSSTLLSAESAPMQQAMHDYGIYLGIAFQLIDDVLDYQGDPQTMGKNIGDDLNEGKMTLPLIYTLCQANTQQAKFIREVIHRKDISQLPEIIQLVQRTNAIDYTRQRAQEFTQKASLCLSHLAPSIYKDSLIRLLDIAIERAN